MNILYQMMSPFNLACLLLACTLTLANTLSKLSSKATTVAAQQQPSTTAFQSTSSVAPLTDPPTSPPWTGSDPTTLETLPAFIPPWIPKAPQSPVPWDFVVQYYGKNISTQDLLIKLNMTSAPFDVANICPSWKHSCESVCPVHGNEAVERSTEKPCYCDKLCLEVGDCCYDYFLRCADGQTKKPQHSTQKCVKTTNKEGDYGFVMINRCPSDNTDKDLETLCTATSSTADLFTMLPVSNLNDNIVFKNVFCARCNHVSNQAYWKFSASCENVRADDIPSNRSLMLEFVIQKCKWHFKEPSNNYKHLKTCLAVENGCTDSELVGKEPLLPGMCSFYVFPVCDEVRKKNPHCEICRGNDISSPYYCRCLRPAPPTPTELPGLGGPPSLDILFDFSSSSSHSVKVGDKTTVVENKACNEGFLFDPFAEKCVQIHKTTISVNKTTVRLTCNGSGFVMMDLSSATLFPNGSIWIPLHNRLYNNGSYFINGSSLFVCMNLTRNFTETTTLTSEKSTITPLQIITYIGCAIFMISLILLIGIYIAFAELRTLPGKNLMSLSCTMLLYHTVYFLTGQTNHTNLCTTVSVLLHYFLLSSFCWMSVMAFDVAKTFGRKGQVARSSSTGGSKAALVKYSIFAWITPAVVVTTSVVLDKTDAVFIGYGDKICWISNGKALLVVLGVPVASILVFNCAALSFTLVSIWRVQKTTRRVADQSQQTSLPVLYIKLSSALGFTWVLGFIVPFTHVEFLAYLFVICNSLQGFFIFLAFVANKRTMNKVKGAWKARRPKSSSLLNTHTNANHSKTRTTRV